MLLGKAVVLVRIHAADMPEDRVQWLMPVIPALGETEADGSHEVGSSKPACITWGNPISIKNTKN